MNNQNSDEDHSGDSNRYENIFVSIFILSLKKVEKKKEGLEEKIIFHPKK